MKGVEDRLALLSPSRRAQEDVTQENDKINEFLKNVGKLTAPDIPEAPPRDSRSRRRVVASHPNCEGRGLGRGDADSQHVRNCR